MYTILKTAKGEYKCRLNARACVELEKALGTNPINVLAKVAQTQELPSIETIITILHYSLQAFNHSVDINKTYDIYDDYIEAGNTLTDILPFLIEIFKCSGFFKDEGSEPKGVEEETAPKFAAISK